MNHKPWELLLFILQANHKKIFYFFLFGYLLSTLNLNAQYPTIRERIENLPNFDNKPIHYGYFIGFNDYDFKFEYEESYYKYKKLSDIELEKSSGFNVGLIADLRLHEYINIRLEPGLYASQRKLLYPNQADLPNQEDKIREIKSTYIHLPLLIKFSSKRVNNFKPYIVGGISTSLNLSSNQKSNDDNLNNVFRLKSTTLNYEAGFGIDFYLPYFKFSPSIRGVFSIDNEIIQDNDPESPWTSNVKKLFSRGVLINLTFE